MSEISPRVRYCLTFRSDERWREPPRLLYDCELVHVLEGEFLLRIGRSEMTLRTGAVALIGPRAEHESWVLPGKSVVRQCLHFDWNDEHIGIQSPLFTMGNEPYREECMHPVDPEFAPCLNRVYWPREVDSVRPILVDAFDRLAAGDPIGESLLYPVLLHLQGTLRSEPVRRIGSRSDRTMLEIKHYIDVHFAEPLTLETLSARARLSPSHLCQAFRKCIGMPPNKYLNHLRIEHACRLLRMGEWNVSEVAQAVGFTDNNYFTRFFKQRIGVSPGAYMRQDRFSAYQHHTSQCRRGRS